MDKPARPSGTATNSGSRKTSCAKKQPTQVPFRRDRLKAALRASRLSQNALAAQITELKQKTLNDMVTKGRKCRRSMLEEISEVLQVPTDWLTGENDHLPLQPFLRENAYRSLAECQFVIRCNKAFERDMRRRRNRGEDSEPQRRLQGEFIFALYSMLDHRRWSVSFFRPDWDIAPPGERGIPMSSEREAAITNALIAALEQVLSPWLDGPLALDYERVIEAARSL